MSDRDMSSILKGVKNAIREPYDWPGGYPVYTVMSDGGLMCADCARKNYKRIAQATLMRDHLSSWFSFGCMVLWEGTGDQCCNCNKDLESAYGED